MAFKCLPLGNASVLLSICTLHEQASGVPSEWSVNVEGPSSSHRSEGGFSDRMKTSQNHQR